MRIMEELNAWFDSRLDMLIEDGEAAVRRLRLVRVGTENELWKEDGVDGESTLEAIEKLLGRLAFEFVGFHEDLVAATGIAAPDGLSRGEDKA